MHTSKERACPTRIGTSANCNLQVSVPSHFSHWLPSPLQQILQGKRMPGISVSSIHFHNQATNGEKWWNSNKCSACWDGQEWTESIWKFNARPGHVTASGLSTRDSSAVLQLHKTLLEHKICTQKNFSELYQALNRCGWRIKELTPLISVRVALEVCPWNFRRTWNSGTKHVNHWYRYNSWQ